MRCTPKFEWIFIFNWLILVFLCFCSYPPHSIAIERWIWREGLLSTLALGTIVFGKHLSVLNFIRQANKCATDYYMYLHVSTLEHTHTHSNILIHFRSTYTSTQARFGSMRKPNCLANSNSIFNGNTLDALFTNDVSLFHVILNGWSEPELCSTNMLIHSKMKRANRFLFDSFILNILYCCPSAI